MGEVDNMTLYELLQYADKELDIVIKEVSRAKKLERKMELEAERSYPKEAQTLQKYLEYIRKYGYENPRLYSVAYDHIRDEVIVIGGVVNCIPFNQEHFFVNFESTQKFLKENEDELRWYFKEYKKL